MPQGGLAQVLTQADAPEELVKIARRAEADPEQREELYTLAAEALMGEAGIPKKDQAKQVLLFDGGYVEKAEGGLADAAESVRSAGRGKDEVLLHVSPGEYDTLVEMWGEPTINPDTGIPEYGLKKWLKKGKKALKKVVKSKAFKLLAPIALNVFAPGVGAMIGAKLGVGSMMGNALVRGGLGAVSGGKKGAIKGAFAGAAGTKGVAGELGSKFGLSGKTADVVGKALIKGGGTALAGEGFGRGAIQGGLEAYSGMGAEEMGQGIREKFGITAGIGMPPAQGGLASIAGSVGDAATAIPGGSAALAPGAAGPVAGGPAAGGLDIAGGLGDIGKLAKKYALPALLGAGALKGQGEYEEAAPPWEDGGGSFGESLPQIAPQNRSFVGLPSEEDYYTYGQVGSPQSGQHLFIDPPTPFGQPMAPDAPGAPPPGAQPGGGGITGQLYAGKGQAQPGALGQVGGLSEEQLRSLLSSGVRGFQRGGEYNYWEQNEDVPNTTPGVSARGRYVKGEGNGRSDDIPARLSDGEYVIDAESVALLGDGSGDAGAQRLDEMRKNLRKHKAKNLGKGEFSHKAKHPDQYMGKLRRRAKTYEHGGVHNVAGSGPSSGPTAGGNI
jgi:hypothetical protein